MCPLVRGHTRCCCCGGFSWCQERHLLPGCSMGAGCAVVAIDYMCCVDGVCVAGSTRTCCCWGWLSVSPFMLVSFFSFQAVARSHSHSQGLLLWVLACMHVYTCVLPVKVCLVHSTLIRAGPVHAKTAPNITHAPHKQLASPQYQPRSTPCPQQQPTLVRGCSQLIALLVPAWLQLHGCKARRR